MKDEVHVIDNLAICPGYKELPEKLVCVYIVWLIINMNRKNEELNQTIYLLTCMLDNDQISKFAGYLSKINHHKAVAIGRVKPVRLEFSWQTRYNCVDCGVFLMRHMEIYKGLNKMEDGLAPEGVAQQEQLNELRRKYATKIMLAL